ncbi:hypothetical protein Lal_00010204 [Lupinus albus]|nr:hypothetical protein Lal_00010204 [Lupinus albus]
MFMISDMTSSASSPNTIQSVIPTTQSVRAKSDPTWDHCQLVQDVDGKKSIKCLYCSKCYKGGGIHRIKQHLAGEKGDVLPCLSVPVEVVMNTRFWNDCAIIVNIVAPLIRLLRIVDADERPSLPYVYDGMCRARKTIKNVFMNKKSLYKPYTRIIKQRWDKQLRTKLHCATYFLNPTFYYDKENFCIKPEVQQGWLDVLQAKVTTSKTDFFKQSCIYHDKVGSFGNSMAIETVKHLRPDQWWSQFGFSAPMVSQLAIKILSQTASSSGCERNWSVFERIHTRNRNKLEHKRLNDLVYVHYNLGLKDRTLDPVDYESMENIEFWITEEKEETPLIDYDEIEKMFYYDLSNPILDLTKDDEGMVEGQNITIDGELNLDSFLLRKM